MNTHFILASQSPRRRELFQLLGLPFKVMVANADEGSITEPDPTLNVMQTARLKSAKIASQLDANEATAAVILAADTTVAFADAMLNKPANEREARQMLQRLKGKKHEVHTGMVLLEPNSGREWQGVSTAVVTMRPYLQGCYCNVMGLPVCDLIMALAEFLSPTATVLPTFDFTIIQRAHLHYPCATLTTLLT
jgi:MAF protein